MKNILLTIFISSILFQFSINNSFAQEYYPLTGENKHWIVVYYDIWGNGNVETIYDYHMTGDTVVGGLEYNKVYRRELVVTEDLQPPFAGATNYQLFGLIRDHVEQRKVYAIRLLENEDLYCPINEEYLMYDFSPLVGDTIDFCTMLPSMTTLGFIHETNLFGEPTRMYTPLGNHPYFEGIGHEGGLFELMIIYVKEDNYPPYLAYYCPTGDCDVLLGNDEVIDKRGIVVSPNPASEHVRFSINENEKIKIQIYNTKGEFIEELEGNSELIWNCKSIPSGLYFYNAHSNHNFYSGKVIIQ